MKVAQIHDNTNKYETLDKDLKKKILKRLRDKLLVADAAKRAKL